MIKLFYIALNMVRHIRWETFYWNVWFSAYSSPGTVCVRIYLASLVLRIHIKISRPSWTTAILVAPVTHSRFDYCYRIYLQHFNLSSQPNHRFALASMFHSRYQCFAPLITGQNIVKSKGDGAKFVTIVPSFLKKCCWIFCASKIKNSEVCAVRKLCRAHDGIVFELEHTHDCCISLLCDGAWLEW